MRNQQNKTSSNTLMMTSLMVNAVSSLALLASAFTLQTATMVSTKAAKDRATTTQTAQTAQAANTLKTETSGYTNENAELNFKLLAQTSNEASADAKRLLEMQLANRFQNAAAKMTMAELLTPAGQSAFAQKVCRDQIEGATPFTGISCTIGPIRKL